MPQPTIKPGASLVTLINVFTVETQDQQRLIAAWQQATDELLRHLPGFISANLHRSLDGTKVVNYAQWESQEAFQAMLQDPRRPRYSNNSPKLPSPKSYQSTAPDRGQRTHRLRHGFSEQSRRRLQARPTPLRPRHEHVSQTETRPAMRGLHGAAIGFGVMAGSRAASASLTAQPRAHHRDGRDARRDAKAGLRQTGALEP